MYGAFFHWTNFEDILNEDLAKAVAKKADEVLAKHAVLVYGNMFADGSAAGFESEKKDLATHVALLVGPRTMAAFAPKEAFIKTDAMTEDDMSKALQERVRVLEALLAQQNKKGY